MRSPAAGAATRTEKSTTLPPAPHPERRNPPPCCRPPPEQRNPPPCRRRCTPNREIRSPNRDSATARQTHGRYGGRPDPGLRTTQRLPPQRAGDRAHMLRRCPSGNPRMQNGFRRERIPAKTVFQQAAAATRRSKPGQTGAAPAARSPTPGATQRSGRERRSRGVPQRSDPAERPDGASGRNGRNRRPGPQPLHSRLRSGVDRRVGRPAAAGRPHRRGSPATPSVR